METADGDHLVALLQTVAELLFLLGLLRLRTDEEQPENDNQQDDENEA